MEMKTKYFSIFSYKRRNIKSIAAAVSLIGLLLCVYQLLMAKMIDEADRERLNQLSSDKLRNRKFGTLIDSDDKERLKYITEHKNLETLTRENSDEKYFICNPSGTKVLQSYLNDDYCDCPDGSDEPQTNACPESLFICHHTYKIVSLPSSRVNDGICDCCDGSDESGPVKHLINLPRAIQKNIGQYLAPCPNVCPS